MSFDLVVVVIIALIVNYSWSEQLIELWIMRKLSFTRIVHQFLSFSQTYLKIHGDGEEIRIQIQVGDDLGLVSDDHIQVNQLNGDLDHGKDDDEEDKGKVHDGKEEGEEAYQNGPCFQKSSASFYLSSYIPRNLQIHSYREDRRDREEVSDGGNDEEGSGEGSDEDVGDDVHDRDDHDRDDHDHDDHDRDDHDGHDDDAFLYEKNENQICCGFYLKKKKNWIQNYPSCKIYDDCDFLYSTILHYHCCCLEICGGAFYHDDLLSCVSYHLSLKFP